MSSLDAPSASTPAARKCPVVTATDAPFRTVERPAARILGERRRTSLCIVVPQILAGDGALIARGLRRHGKRDALVLAQRSDRRELVQLLTSGVRGAVVIEHGEFLALDHGAPGRGRRPNPAPLTARELSVLALVAEGQSNREVGESLGLSALTVKSHLARIARKLGTGDRAALVALALRQGLM